MNLRLTYRTIWKINALIILVAGTGICLMLGYAAFSFVQSRFQLHQKEDTVNVEGNVGAQWRLGPFEKASAAGYMVAPVYSAQSYSVSLYGKEATAVRNYLFVNLQDMSSRWLVPNNDRLIVAMERLAIDGKVVGWNDEEKPVKWLVFHVVASDTDGDKRLTDRDRKTIAVANADGSQYAEVLRNVDTILGETWTTGDNLLVVYSADGKNLVAEISLAGRTVSVTKDLPKLGQ
jgi:hypothetical protein